MSLYVDQKIKELMARVVSLEQRIEQLEAKVPRPMIGGHDADRQRMIEQEKLDKRSREYRQTIGRS